MVIAKKRPRRRVSRRAKTGEYISTKTGKKCKYRSGWEAKYMEFLDNDPDVVDWEYESITIPYVSNKKTGRIRKYTPDMYVVRSKGRKELIEVKPINKLDKITVIKKAEAAKRWCEAFDVEYKFITEIDLKELGLL